MSHQLTIYKVRAFIYDVYCKCANNQRFTWDEVIKYHSIGKPLKDILIDSGRILKVNSLYKWMGDAPNEQFIKEIEIQRINIVKHYNSKSKEISIEDIKPYQKEIKQYLKELKKLNK